MTLTAHREALADRLAAAGIAVADAPGRWRTLPAATITPSAPWITPDTGAANQAGTLALTVEVYASTTTAGGAMAGVEAATEAAIAALGRFWRLETVGAPSFVQTEDQAAGVVALTVTRHYAFPHPTDAGADAGGQE